MNNKVKMGILGCCAAVILFAASQLLITHKGYSESDTAYEQIAAMATAAAPETESETEAPTEEAVPETTEPESEKEVVNFPEIDFAALKATNEQIVGWIYLEDSNINYPVAQAGDNDFYLEHMFTGEGNGSGCPFLDAGNKADFSDRHSIIYAHNMKNGTMFAELLNYQNPGYYEAHPRFLLMTPEGNFTVDVFTAYVVSGWGDAWQREFGSDTDFETWLEHSLEESCVNAPAPAPDARILTLSTCAYDFDDARFVVAGVLNPA